MAFEISQIINKYLQDAATIVDKNNDGIINNGTEVSVFLKKAENIKENGLCSEDDYRKILDYCPRETTITNGNKVIQGTKEYEPNEIRQNEYKAELEKLIDDELKNKGLEKNAENISKAIEIIKLKKEINIQIKILENQIDNLKQQKPQDKFKETILATSVAGTGVGIVAGGYTGAKIGAALGSKFGTALGGFPYGTIVGGVVGAFFSGIAGAVGGKQAAKAFITEEDLKQAELEIKNEIETKNNELQKLKEQLENL